LNRVIFQATYYSRGKLRDGFVAPFVPWVASQDAPYAQSRSTYQTVFLIGFACILRAGWTKAARRRQKRADTILIEFDESDN